MEAFSTRQHKAKILSKNLRGWKKSMNKSSNQQSQDKKEAPIIIIILDPDA